jgi:hypothetical protein
MPIIAISRGSYSRGREVAEKTAALLGYRCISREVLLEASQLFDIPELKLRRAIHDAPSLLDRLGRRRLQQIAVTLDGAIVTAPHHLHSPIVKELLEAKVQALERLLMTRLDAQDRALGLQAKEYSRRLDLLNGEAERLRQMQMTYVSRELYERVDAQRCEDIKALESYRDTQIGKQMVLSAIIAAAVSIVIALAWKLVL